VLRSDLIWDGMSSTGASFSSSLVGLEARAAGLGVSVSDTVSDATRW
jgi:hypothetical protein